MGNVVAHARGPETVRTCAGCGRSFSTRAHNAARCARCTWRPRTRAELGPRPRTENLRRLSVINTPPATADDDAGIKRPCTRGECADVPRPCPFVSCRHHLYLDISTRNGSVKLNFPHLEVDEMADSCALDVADRGGATLEELGAVMNLTRERIRQIEDKTLDLVKKRAVALREFSDAPPNAKPRRGVDGPNRPSASPDAEPDTDLEPDDARPRRVSFFAEDDSAADAVCAQVWTIFAKDSNAHGFDARSMRSIRASRALAGRRAETPPVHETTREKPMSLTERQQRVLDAYRACRGEGREPSHLELADMAGIQTKNASSRQALVSVVMRELRKLGLVGAPRRGPGAKSATPAASPAPAPPPARTPAPKPARAASTDPVVAALIAKRDVFLAKAKAIDVAIEALAEAL